MLNRVLRIFIEYDTKECRLDSKRVVSEFALFESSFVVPELDEELIVNYIDDKCLKLSLFDEDIKVLVNFPYKFKSEKCPHLITLLYTDMESYDDMYLVDYLIEIDEHRIFTDSYSKNETDDISYMEPITYNIFPLKIINKNVYIKNIDIENKRIEILCGENKLEGISKNLTPEIDVQFMDIDQGGNTEESTFHITNVVKIRLVNLKQEKPL